MGSEAPSWAEQWGAGGIGAMEDDDTRSQKHITNNNNNSGLTIAKSTASNCLKWIKNLCKRKSASTSNKRGSIYDSALR
ncbi:hypothetical protein Lal_00040738 [Lupinus albus]|uniref:Uncharacterized protein n=1 Tax=Lupinus albus TaxID=3870 RepID=A0A6A4PKJ4_LUPAL|nr:hypothetical protein Lalb_Chr13g0304241 [Lupinus albus]KAF1887141.1 hypothetical protein Lal_00040738 [Lupinus albus]